MTRRVRRTEGGDVHRLTWAARGPTLTGDRGSTRHDFRRHALRLQQPRRRKGETGRGRRKGEEGKRGRSHQPTREQPTREPDAGG